MVDEDLALKVLGGDGVFQLDEQGLVGAITELVVEETLK